jgi:5-methylcytosine-specific restriction endonuclease McrA
VRRKGGGCGGGDVSEYVKRLDFRHAYARRLRAEVYARDDYTCQACGWRPVLIPEHYDGRFTVGPPEARYLTLDHIKPLCAGGNLKEPSNLQTLCDACNGGKSGRVRHEGS